MAVLPDPDITQSLDPQSSILLVAQLMAVHCPTTDPATEEEPHTYQVVPGQVLVVVSQAAHMLLEPQTPE